MVDVAMVQDELATQAWYLQNVPAGMQESWL
jgi:hypothetical protein